MDIEELGDDVDRPISAAGPTYRELATGERARDWALEMSYAYRPELFKSLGWHHKGQSKFRQAIRSIAANLIMAKKLSSTGQVSISRSKKLYGYKKRWRNTLHTYDLVIGAVAWMEANGLLIEHRSVGYAPNDRRATGLQTTIEATPNLLRALWHVPLQRADDFDSIRMRDKNGVRIRFDETEETAAMRARMARVNAMISGIRIVMPSSCTEIAPGFWKCPARTKGQYAYVHLDDMRAYRMFNRESWECNGRLYGVWQNIPKAVREKIRFLGPDGTEIEVKERDYPSNHAYMLHARRGHILTHKPYDVEGPSGKRFSREQGKIALLTMTNAMRHREAVGAVKIRFDREGMTFPAAEDLIELIRDLNPVIADDFHSDAGMSLMHDDSEIALAVIEDMMAQNIPVLPVHDSFVVPKVHYAALKTAMDKAMADYVARVWPKDIAAPVEVVQAFKQASLNDVTKDSGDCQTYGISSVNTPQVNAPLSLSSLSAPAGLSALSFFRPVLPTVVATTSAQYFELLNRDDVLVDYEPSRPTASERLFMKHQGFWPEPDSFNPYAVKETRRKGVRSTVDELADVMGRGAADELMSDIVRDQRADRWAELNNAMSPSKTSARIASRMPRLRSIRPVVASALPFDVLAFDAADDPFLGPILAMFPGSVVMPWVTVTSPT